MFFQYHNSDTDGGKKRARKRSKQETCHKCGERQVSACVQVDNLRVKMCQDCALSAMQNFNRQSAILK